MSVVSGEVGEHELILHALTMCICSFEIAASKTFQVLRHVNEEFTGLKLNRIQVLPVCSTYTATDVEARLMTNNL